MAVQWSIRIRPSTRAALGVAAVAMVGLSPAKVLVLAAVLVAVSLSLFVLLSRVALDREVYRHLEVASTSSLQVATVAGT